MKIYLAAMYSEMSNMRAVARLLQEDGHEITARWINGGEENKAPAAGAQMDLDDIDRAEALVLFTLPVGQYFRGGGRHVEFGYAIKAQKRLIVVGEREQVFCHLPQVEVYDNLTIARAAIKAAMAMEE